MEPIETVCEQDYNCTVFL